jgi:hypothetical protein
MEAIKIQQTEPTLTAQAPPKQRINGLDYDEDGNIINLIPHKVVWDELDQKMIDHYGEVARRLINERRAEEGWNLL